MEAENPYAATRSRAQSPSIDDIPVPPHPAVSVDAETSSDSDDFSNYVGTIASSTASLGAEVFDYQYENGRRYHAYRAGKYLLPNDEAEQDRLDMAHHIFRLSLQGDLCVTKLKDPRRILDVGTGTGIWAIEMGDLFPDAEVIGIDLSPTQPPFVPPNVKFEINDVTDDWTYEENSFDFIFVRGIGGSIQDWPKFLQECYDHLAPGGVLEIVEARANLWFLNDGSVPENSEFYKLLVEWRALSAKIQFDIFPALPGMVKQLPFEDIQSAEKLIPVGPWPKDKTLKELGRWYKMHLLDMALEAYLLAVFTRLGGWQEWEVKVVLAKVRDEMRRNKMHVYTFSSCLTARKPLSV